MPIQINDLEKYVDNVYEAVIIIAKRAKQINNEQKRLLEAEADYDEDVENYDDEEIEVERTNEQKFIRFPKPTRLAINEMLSGRLSYEYLEREE